jgi:CubicO group peptidase (beta-lactamase class C family)
MINAIRHPLLRSAVLASAFLACALAAYASDAFTPSAIDPAAAGMDPVLLARIPAKMQSYVDAGTASGFVTIVVRHGHVAILKAVGYQDRDAKIPMRADSLFRIMSMTKSFTAAGIMILVDEGRLNLLDPASDYLPEFKDMQVNPCAGVPNAHNCALLPASRPITILDLLTHTSGLPGQGAGTPPYQSLADRVHNAHVPLLAQPGAKWIYSQIGYAALGRIIEVCSGKSYADFLTDSLFKPLGMNDTTFFLPASKLSRLAVLYAFDGNGKLIRAAHQPDPDPKVPDPASGAMTTASDMARFYQMLMNKGVLNGRRVLSIAAVQAMTTSWTGELPNVEFSPGLGMGLSFGVIKDQVGTFRYQSLGAFSKGGAYRTYGWGDPAKDMFGIIMYQRTNGGGDTAPETTAFTILANAAIAH